MKKPATVLLIVFVPIVIYCFYKFNPETVSFFPKCPFHYFTGFDCPGCGSQRAIHALLHGDIGKAVDLNLLLTASLPFLAIQFGYSLAGKVINKPPEWRVPQHPLTPKIIWIIVVVFWIVRNIPAEPFSFLKA